MFLLPIKNGYVFLMERYFWLYEWGSLGTWYIRRSSCSVSLPLISSFVLALFAFRLRNASEFGSEF